MIYIYAQSVIGDIIVIQPAFPHNARRALNLHVTNDVPIIGLIENMSYFVCPHHKKPKEYKIFGESVGEELAKEFNIPFLGRIPLIPNLQRKLKKGDPILKVTQPFEKAVDIIVKTPPEKVGIVRKVKERIAKITRDQAVKVLAFIVRKIGKEVPIPATFTFDKGVTTDFVIVDETRTKVLTRWRLRAREEGGLTYVKNPKKIDFEIEMPFRTLARIIMGKKKLRSGRVIPYDSWDAYLNNDLELLGRGATQRAIDLIRGVLFQEDVMEAARKEFKFLEKWI